MNNLVETLQKYIFSTLLIIAGALIIIKGNSGSNMTIDNPDVTWTLFILAGAGLLLGGIISALFIAGFISRMIATVLLVVFLAGSSYFAYANYQSVTARIALENKYSFIRENIKQGLIDIRDIQNEYKKIKGFYTNDFDTLVNFVLNEKTYDIKKTGVIPSDKIGEEYWSVLGYKKTDNDFFSKIESWDEDEALLAGKIKRDTIYKSLLEDIFNPENKSQKDRAFNFNIDSIEFIRNYLSGTLKYSLEADTISDGSPVFLAKEPAPFYILGKDRDTLQVGSLTDTKTTGNWGEY